MKYACVRTISNGNPDFTIVDGLAGLFDDIEKARDTQRSMEESFPKPRYKYEVFLIMPRV